MFEESRCFHATGNLYFQQCEQGAVRIAATNDGKPPMPDGSNCIFDRTVDSGTWGSAVLTMSVYNERPNDWERFMAHHTGRIDMFTGIPAYQSVMESRP